MEISIHGRLVTVIGENVELAVRSAPFQEWVRDLSPDFQVSRIIFQSVDIVGPPDARKVLFIKFAADVVDGCNRFIPGIVCMRGGAVAILVILECEDIEYTLLTVQPRFPIGCFAFPEIPAGMLDGSGDFAGKAAEELRQETGLEITTRGLTDLTQIFYRGWWPGMYPSPGGCDECIRIFLHREKITPSGLAQLQGKCTGVLEEGEQITLKVIPLQMLPLETPDAKSIVALALYNFAKAQKMIPA